MTQWPVAFLVPEDLESETGGNIYDRTIMAGLRARGRNVRVLHFAKGFPFPSDADLSAADTTLAKLPDGCLTVIDGLGLGAMPQVAAAHRTRLKLVALLHHPLAQETGLSDSDARRLFDSERRALAAVGPIIVTSPFTQQALGAYAVTSDRITVVRPGTASAPLAAGSGGPGLSLLSVGSIVPRKGHRELIEALAELKAYDWSLTIAGSGKRSPETTRELTAAIDDAGLRARIDLVGEVPAAELTDLYQRCDLFILASYYEGYGMALTEALAAGLPIVSTTGGAIPSTLPDGVAILVPPGDVAALRTALTTVMTNEKALAQLRASAVTARASLATWDDAVRLFDTALSRIAGDGNAIRP